MTGSQQKIDSRVKHYSWPGLGMIVLNHINDYSTGRLPEQDISIYTYYFRTKMSILCKYTMRKLLGKGGSGAVYSGIKKQDGVQEAIKKVKKENSNILGVVRMLDYYDHGEAYFIVMERFGSMDIFDWIELMEGINEKTA